MNELTIGIDPDLHNTGLALVWNGELRGVQVARVPQRIKGTEAVLRMCLELPTAVALLMHGSLGFEERVGSCAVEGQTIYAKGKARPIDILRLGHVAGGAVNAVASVARHCGFWLPEPRTWKKNIPPDIHAKRILSRVGKSLADIENLLSQGGCKAPATAAPHVISAIGLALWGESEACRRARAVG